MELEEKVARMQEIERRGLLDRLSPRQRAGWEEYKRRHNMNLQETNNNSSWVDTANDTLRTIGGAVEAWDSGKYLGFGKKAGGLINAIGAWPVDRIAQLAGVENTPTFGDRYNEIVQGAKDMHQEFAEEHPIAALGTELTGVIKGAPANIEKYAVERMAKATSNSGKYAKAAGKIVGLLGSGAISATGLGMGNAENIPDYLASKDIIQDASLGAGANAAFGAIGQAAKAATKSFPKIAGMSTGTSDNIISRAFDAGKRQSKTFLENLRGEVEPERITVEAKKALRDMIDGNQDMYQKNIIEASKNRVKITPQEVINKFNREIQEATAGGKGDFLLIDDYGKVAKKINNLLKNFNDTPELHNTYGMDKLKQAIGRIKVQEGSPADALRTKVYNDVSQSISSKNPLYKKAMDTYATNIGEINEIRNTLSLRNNTNVDTTLRKLQSIGRNNVNTNYGYRNRLLDELDYYGDLQDAISGQALNSWKPRGTAGVVGGLNALSGAVNAVTNPSALFANLAYALGSSPRLTGEAAYQLGSLADRLSKIKVGNINAGSLASREKNQ